MKICFFIFLANLFAFEDINAQNVINARIKNEIERLKIDTTLIYSFPCSGCSTSDSCNKEKSHYLFWKQNDNFYIKKFDYCKGFITIKLNTENPLSFYLHHREAINKEQIKPPTFQKVIKRGNNLDTVLLTSSVDHSYNHDLIAQLKDKIVQKTIDVYDLEFKKSNDGLRNIYYDSNRRTKTNTLVNKISKLIKHIEKNNLWQEDVGMVKNK